MYCRFCFFARFPALLLQGEPGQCLTGVSDKQSTWFAYDLLGWIEDRSSIVLGLESRQGVIEPRAGFPAGFSFRD